MLQHPLTRVSVKFSLGTLNFRPKETVGPPGAWAGTSILNEGFNHPFHQPSRQGCNTLLQHPFQQLTGLHRRQLCAQMSPQPSLHSTLGSLDFSFQFLESFSFKDGPPRLQEEGQEGVFLRTVMVLER